MAVDGQLLDIIMEMKDELCIEKVNGIYEVGKRISNDTFSQVGSNHGNY